MTFCSIRTCRSPTFLTAIPPPNTSTPLLLDSARFERMTLPLIVAIEAVRNDLFARFAEAHGRYKASTIAAVNYRDKVLPSLTQAYAAIVRRYQVEPEKVGFSDIVVAQQNLAQAMQAYQSILDAQWKAVVDLANITQVDELEPPK